MMGRLFRGKIKEASKSTNNNVGSNAVGNTRKTRTAAKNKTTGGKQMNQLRCDTADVENNKLFNDKNTENDVVTENCDQHYNHDKDIVGTNSEGVSLASDGSPSKDSNSCSCPSGLPEKIESLNSKKPSNRVKRTKSKTDPKINTLLDHNCKNIENEGLPIVDNSNDELIKEAVPRPVLTDKTNSVLKSNCEKAKNKVHFSSVNSVRRITQRRISDFFHSEDHHKINEFPELKFTQENNKELNDESILNESVKMLDKSLNKKLREKKLNKGADLSKSVNDHIPVYKQPVVEGRDSFRLTPPKVVDKEALYEFEVDENEEPRAKKKRRPVKTYKKRKRLCTNNVIVKPSELKNIPQRTMALRTDQQISENRVAGICADIDSVEIDTPNVNQPAVSRGNNFNGLNTANLKTTKHTQIKKSLRQGGNHSIGAKILDSSATAEKSFVVQQNVKNSNANGSLSISSKMNVSAVSQGSKAVDNQCSRSNLTVSHSPLPDYSRLHEGIQIGPVYNSSSVNCNDSELDCTFMRGVTASTPCRIIQSPVVKQDFQIRLSGGAVSNRFRKPMIVDSDSDSEEEFFGFRFNENHEDSIRDIHIEKTPQKENESFNNEPVQKISVREVISILRKNFGSNSKHDEKKVTPTKALLFDDSLLSTPRACDSCDELPEVTSDAVFSHGRSPCIDKYLTKGGEKKKKRVQLKEPDVSFHKPPRRSYSITPRKKNAPNYRESVEDNGENSEEEVEAPKKQCRKAHKPSKKEEKEMNKLAAMMNSQFQEVEKYQLLIE